MVSTFTKAPSANGSAAAVTLAVQDLDGEKVRNSIQRGIRWLINNKQNNRWRGTTSYEGGHTALAVLALLNSGVSPDSPDLKDPLNYLTTIKPGKTYVSSLIIMVLVEADPQRYKPIIERHARFLIDTQFRGGFGYGGNGRSVGDSSNSQFAILGLHAAQSAGVEIDRSVWEDAQRYWEEVFSRQQGGFAYVPHFNCSGSMTCAGICSMTIIEQNLNEGTSRAKGEEILCCQAAPTNPMIESGIDWLGRFFTVQRNPSQGSESHSSALFYYMYSLERTGRFTGRRFFGQHDWYREGTARLLGLQTIDGSWVNGSQDSLEEYNPVVATSMALLFLSKGLRPILIGKYKHNQQDWDPHPYGVQYLTHFVEKAWDRRLNWQTIEAEAASAAVFGD